MRQSVADFRQALKRIHPSRLQRLQILTEQVRVSVSQTLSRQEIRFAAGKGSLGSRVAQLLEIARVRYKEHLRSQQQVRRELLGMGPTEHATSPVRIFSRLAHA